MPPTPYHVDNSQRVADDFRALLTRASAEGRLDEVRTAARSILDALTWIPDEYGESMGVLPFSGMHLRQALRCPLTVYFAVHEPDRVVFIRRFHLWPRSGG